MRSRYRRRLCPPIAVNPIGGRSPLYKSCRSRLRPETLLVVFPVILLFPCDSVPSVVSNLPAFPND
jgi:hypothetical protein